MTRNRRLIVAAGVAFVIVGVFVISTPDASAQCVMCKTMLATPEGQKMVAALRSGVLLLLAAPFAIFGTIATLAVRSKRRRDAAALAGPTERRS